MVRTVPEPAAANSWRPQFLWLPMGLFVGAASGALVGLTLFELLLVLEGDWTSSYMWGHIGLIYGGMFGGAVGLVAGVFMALLVGSHLPLDVARTQALLVGSISTLVVDLAIFLLWVGREPWISPLALLHALVVGALSRKAVSLVRAPLLTNPRVSP